MLEIQNKAEFEKEVKEGTTLVDIYAPWCGPCKMITPVLEELEKEYTDVKFIKVNGDVLKDVVEDLGVMSVPTLITMVNGEIVGKSVGFQPSEAIKELIDKAVNKS